MEAGYYAGIDLGTMYTAVAGSNGTRQVTPSEVGMPRDELVRKSLGKDLFFGSEIELHRMALTVLRPFEHGRWKYGDLPCESASGTIADSLAAARCLLDHAMAFLGFPEGARVRCVMGVPAQASLVNRRTLLSIARSCIESVVLVSEPFAVGFNLDSPTKRALIVDIGAGTTDICHFYGAFPDVTDQLTVGYGGDHVDRDFRERVVAEHPQIQMSLATARRIKEKSGFVGTAEQAVHVRLPVRQGPPQVFDLTESLQASCLQIADRVVQGILTVLEQIQFEGHAEILENIVLSGGGGQLRGLDAYIESELNEYGYVHVTRLYDSAFAGAQGALHLARQLPESLWLALQQEAYDASPDTSRKAA
jgi:rod shape-determining protein MreB and related proteins